MSNALIVCLAALAATTTQAAERCTESHFRLDAPNVKCRIVVEDWKTPYVELDGRWKFETQTRI